MHPAKVFKRFLASLVALASLSPFDALAVKTRQDLCGISVHADDTPGIGNFSSIEATWTVPTVTSRRRLEKDVPLLSIGVALCCGDDCSTRLVAGLKVARSPHYTGLPDNYNVAAAPFVKLGPRFSTYHVPFRHWVVFNATDAVWARLELQSVTKARATFTKLESSSHNVTVDVDIEIKHADGHSPQLQFVSRSEKFEDQSEWYKPQDNQATPQTLCGKSAWWLASDTIDPVDPADFTPIMFAGHGLGTADGKSFPADLPYSGLARSWNMVHQLEGETEEVCRVRQFVGSSMTLLQSPKAWAI